MSDETTTIPDGAATMPVQDLGDMITGLCGVYHTALVVNAFSVELKPVEVDETETSFTVYVIVHWLGVEGKSELSNVERMSFSVDEFGKLTTKQGVALFRERLRETYQRSVLMLCVALLNQPWAETVLADLGLAVPVRVPPGLSDEPTESPPTGE